MQNNPTRAESKSSDQPSLFPALDPVRGAVGALGSAAKGPATEPSAKAEALGTVGDLPRMRAGADFPTAEETVSTIALHSCDSIQCSLFPEADVSVTSVPAKADAIPAIREQTNDGTASDVRSASASTETVEPPLLVKRRAYPRNTIVRVPLADIAPVVCAWHLRRDPEPPAIDDLLDTVRTAGVLEPIHLTEDGERLLIVSGVRRYHAAMRRRAEGGPADVDVIILPDTDPAHLLRLTLLEALTRHQPSYLEIGWGLLRYWRMVGHPADQLSQVALMRHLDLVPVTWKSRFSEYLTKASAMPEEVVLAAAAAHGCRVRDISDQRRQLLRSIEHADPRAHPVIIDVLAESAARDADAAPAVRQVIAAATDPQVLERLLAGVASGAPALTVLATLPQKAVKDAIDSSRPSVRARVRALASAVARWCGRIFRRATDRIRATRRGGFRRSQLPPDTD